MLDNRVAQSLCSSYMQCRSSSHGHWRTNFCISSPRRRDQTGKAASLPTHEKAPTGSILETKSDWSRWSSVIVTGMRSKSKTTSTDITDSTSDSTRHTCVWVCVTKCASLTHFTAFEIHLLMIWLSAYSSVDVAWLEVLFLCCIGHTLPLFIQKLDVLFPVGLWTTLAPAMLFTIWRRLVFWYATDK